jgi:nucleotide-binding universal stress UspA family protein
MFKRILVPVDFTAGSNRALRHAASLAQTHYSRVLTLHVVPPICFTVDCGYGPVNRVDPDEASLRRTRAQLQKLVHQIVPAQLAYAVSVQTGEPIEQIVTAARKWKADLIIMLAHDARGGDSAPSTHTVDRLMRKVRCPVLLLHPTRRLCRQACSNAEVDYAKCGQQPGE